MNKKLHGGNQLHLDSNLFSQLVVIKKGGLLNGTM